MSYAQFLQRKTRGASPKGITPKTMPPFMRADQTHVTGLGLSHGRYAIFADCGLGKTIDELEWGRQVSEYGRVLLLAPLCVGIQTAQIAQQFGYEVTLCKTQADVRDGINITNYERLDSFEPDAFVGVIPDESGILKNYSGATCNALIESFARTPYKLCCSATPAPNDYMELGTHAEFLGVMTRSEMLSMFFIHDGGETQKWRLKGHAEPAFWDWVASWSVTYSKPSDLNPKFSDDGFNLPPLKIHSHIVDMPCEQAGYLFAMPAQDLAGQRQVKRASIDQRITKAAEIGTKAQRCVYWCDLNDEGDALEAAIPGARQLRGSQPLEEKEEILLAFTNGEIKDLITKQRITSFGLNWQHCWDTVFAGPNFSYEGAYQAIKRFYRFGQKNEVNAHWVLTDLEYNVFAALMEKMRAHGTMKEALSGVA